MTASTPSEQAAASPLRWFYLDDSGSVDTGFIVYAWIEVTPDHWRTGLGTWIDLRKDLYANYSIPPAKELHATKFVSGRDRISTDPKVNRSKALRRQVMEQALTAIGSEPTLRVGAVYRQTTTTGSAYARERDNVYRALVDHLDTRLSTTGELGMIFMDGDGSEPGYKRVHRGLKLAHRRIIEDPLFQGAHSSQWIQMADITAWTTYQSLLRHRGKEFAWPWYDRFLRSSDVNGQPVRV